MKPISLAVVGLAFAALGCPPRGYEGLTNENLPMDKVVIVERAALAADRPDTTVIFERAEPSSDEPLSVSPANEPRDPRDEAGSSVEAQRLRDVFAARRGTLQQVILLHHGAAHAAAVGVEPGELRVGISGELLVAAASEHRLPELIELGRRRALLMSEALIEKTDDSGHDDDAERKQSISKHVRLGSDVLDLESMIHDVGRCHGHTSLSKSCR
jgi:hypothetical protein